MIGEYKDMLNTVNRRLEFIYEHALSDVVLNDEYSILRKLQGELLKLIKLYYKG